VSERDQPSGWDMALRGAAAGVAGTLVQTMLGKAEERALLPPWEDSNIAPRFMNRLARDVGLTLPASAEWVLGTAFHLGYGVTWGALYAAARERLHPHPVAGGLALGALIYGITFPRWGGAVQTQTERPPEHRTRAMEFVAASVTLGYGLATALAYEKIRRTAG
jgi:hypothetical protein